MPHDLLLKGGTVIDPANSRHAALDVAIGHGRVQAVEPSIPAGHAIETLDVAGKLVTPGLIDIHAHVFPTGEGVGEETDARCAASGVTAIYDAGSVGSLTFQAGRYLADRAVRTRLGAFVHLSAIGLAGATRAGELENGRYADPEGCAATIRQNRDLAIGVKLRFSHKLLWRYDTEPLRMARSAADMADVPLMVHITDAALPVPAILTFLKRGDIVTHCFHAFENGIMGPRHEAVLDEVWAAQKRGVIFDCAHGRHGHFNFPFIRKLLERGFLPDTISTDLTLPAARKGPVFDLPTTMSKLLNLGVSLDDVVRGVTANAARALGVGDRFGTLTPGVPADVAVFEMQEGTFDFVDTDGNHLAGTRRLRALLTVRDGRIVYRAPDLRAVRE
jgi:dihydroorotase